MTRTRTLILFGAGPGIGNHTASHFATAGINHIILLSRNTDRLQTSDKPFISRASPDVKVSTLGLDLADLNSIPSVLKQLDELTVGEDVEVIVFNAARIRGSEILKTEVAELDEDLKTTTLSLYLIAQHYIPVLQSLAPSTSLKPALLVTNSHLPWDPIPQLLSLSLVKAAQRNMVQSFQRAFKNSGVQIGLVNIEGTVAPENKVLNPAVIGGKIVEFWKEGGDEVSIKE